MAKAKYAELIVPSDSALPRSLAGMVIVSDYTSDGRRHLFLKRVEAFAQLPTTAAPKRKRAAAKKRIAQEPMAQPSMVVAGEASHGS